MELSEIGLLCEPVTPPYVEPISPDRCNNDLENVRIQTNNQQTTYRFLSTNAHPSLYPSCPSSLNAVADCKELCYNNEHVLSSCLEDNASSLKSRGIRSFTDRRQVFETVCTRQVHDINLLESHANSPSLLPSVQKYFDHEWSNNISSPDKRVLPFLDGHINSDLSGMPCQMLDALNAEDSNYNYPSKSKNTSKTPQHSYFDGCSTSQLSQDLRGTSNTIFENDLTCLSTRSTSNVKRDIDHDHISMSQTAFQGSDFTCDPKCTKGSSRTKRKRSCSKSSSTESAIIKEVTLHSNDTNFDDMLHSKSHGCKNSMQRSTEFSNLPSSSALSSRKSRLKNITDLRELLNNSRHQNQSPDIDDLLVRSDQMKFFSPNVSPEEGLNQYYPALEVKHRKTPSLNKERHHFTRADKDYYLEPQCLNRGGFDPSESCSSAYGLDSHRGGSNFQDSKFENYSSHYSKRHFDYHHSDALHESLRPATAEHSRNIDNRSPLESRLLISISQRKFLVGKSDHCANDLETSRKGEESRRVIVSSARRSRSRSRSYSSSLKSKKSFDSGSTYEKKKQSRRVHKVRDNNTSNCEDLFGDRWAHHDEYNHGCAKDEHHWSLKEPDRRPDEEIEGQSLKELEEKRQCLIEACYWTGLAGAKSSVIEENWREYDSSPKKPKSQRHHSSPTFGKKRKRKRESDKKERGHKRSKKKRHRKHHSPEGEDGDPSDEYGFSCHGDESGGGHQPDESGGGHQPDEVGSVEDDDYREGDITTRQEIFCSDGKIYHCHGHHVDDGVIAAQTTAFVNNDYYGERDDDDDEDADRLCIDTTVENINPTEDCSGGNSEDCGGENIEDAHVEHVCGDVNNVDNISKGGFIENWDKNARSDHKGEDGEGENIGQANDIAEDVDGENWIENNVTVSKEDHEYLDAGNKEHVHNRIRVPDYPQNGDSVDVLRSNMSNECHGNEDLNGCYDVESSVCNGGDSSSCYIDDSSNLDGINQHIQISECQGTIETRKDYFSGNDNSNDEADGHCYEDGDNESLPVICGGGDDDDDDSNRRLIIETQHSAESIEKDMRSQSPSEDDKHHISITDSTITEGDSSIQVDSSDSQKSVKFLFSAEGPGDQNCDIRFGEAAAEVYVGGRSCEENEPESDCCEKILEEHKNGPTFESEGISTESRDSEETSRDVDCCYEDGDDNCNAREGDCCDGENDVACDEKDSENIKDLNENVLEHVCHFNNRTPSYDSAEDVGADLIGEDREDERYSLCSDGFNDDDDNIKSNCYEEDDARHESCTPVYNEDDGNDLYCQRLSRCSKIDDKYDEELSDELNGGSYTPTANTDHIPGLSPVERTSTQGAYTPTSKPPSLLGDESPISPVSSPCSPPPSASMGFSDLTQVLIQTLGNNALLGNATNNTNGPINSLLGSGGDVVQQLLTRVQSIYQQSSINNNISGFSSSNPLLSLPFLLQPHQKTINPTVLHYLGLQSLSALGRSSVALPGVLGDVGRGGHAGTAEGPRVSYSPFDVNTVSPRSEDAISFSPPSLPAGCNEAQTDGPNLSDLKSCDGGSSKNAVPVDTEMKVKATDKADLQQKLVADIKEILRPVFKKGKIDKEDYKDILRKTVPKILKSHKLSYNRDRITRFTEAYIQKIIATKKYYSKKTTS